MARTGKARGPVHPQPASAKSTKRAVNSVTGEVPSQNRRRPTPNERLAQLAHDLDMWPSIFGDSKLSPAVVDYALERLTEAHRFLLKQRREYTVTCQQCGNIFTPVRSHAVFCSSPCRQTAYRHRRSGVK